MLQNIPEEASAPADAVVDDMTKQEKVDLLKQELEDQQEDEEDKQPEVDELVDPLWIKDPDLG